MMQQGVNLPRRSPYLCHHLLATPPFDPASQIQPHGVGGRAAFQHARDIAGPDFAHFNFTSLPALPRAKDILQDLTPLYSFLLSSTCLLSPAEQVHPG